ncbi:hypothetical protein EYF80_062288 [Liparis tanakae]|uniref:Uncharacterized protein n=1 Tax=Liparis tanakae TaxID=230148 RepID=A0A4Z2EF64_9TELE|nr:hypothetical protein EYF80_062288 [Liparis tanakae]
MTIHIDYDFHKMLCKCNNCGAEKSQHFTQRIPPGQRSHHSDGSPAVAADWGQLHWMKLVFTPNRKA